jgi:hypothetical protein
VSSVISYTVATTALSTNISLTSLSPIGAHVISPQSSRSRWQIESPYTLLQPSGPSSEWVGWALNGRLGYAFEWFGKQIAQIGAEIVPRPSEALTAEDGKKAMFAHESELISLLAEPTLIENNEGKIRAELNAYLRQGATLVRKNELDAALWAGQLRNIHQLVREIGQEEIAFALKKWIKELTILSNQESDNVEVNSEFEQNSNFEVK